MNTNLETLLAALRNNAESTETDANGVTWGCAYLDNARPKDCTPRQFAQRLGALEKSGDYRKASDEYRGVFGYVRMQNESCAA